MFTVRNKKYNAIASSQLKNTQNNNNELEKKKFHLTDSLRSTKT